MSAEYRLAKASATYESKLAETRALLARAAVDYQPLTQASSLGAEDVVIISISIQAFMVGTMFVAEGVIIPAETLALLERFIETHGEERVHGAIRPWPTALRA